MRSFFAKSPGPAAAVIGGVRAFVSWQNSCAAGFFFLWTIAIIFKSKRTPLEYMMPSLDGELVQAFNRTHQ